MSDNRVVERSQQPKQSQSSTITDDRKTDEVVINDQFWTTTLEYLKQNYDDNIADAIKKNLRICLEVEEYSYTTIVEDIEAWDETHESIIVNFIIKQTKIEDTKLNQKNLVDHLSVIFRVPKKKPKGPSKVDWYYDKQTVDNARDYMNEQCKELISAEQDVDLLKVVSIGLRNRIPLLPLLYDIYSKYRIHETMESRTGITPNTFINNTAFFQEVLNRNKYKDMVKDIGTALKLFEHRFVSPFIFNRAKLIMDSYSECVDYTLMISNVLASFIQMNTKCLPLQVEFVIMPNASRIPGCFTSPGSNNEYDSSDDGSSDDGDADFSETKYQESRTNPSVAVAADFRALEKDIDELVGEHNYKKLDLEPGADVNHNATYIRQVQDLLDTFVGQDHHKRIALVIDRQFSKKKDRMYVYSLPSIPHDYCIETLIFNAANVVLPQTKDKKKPPWIGGKYDHYGMLVLSFQIMQVNQIRVQWFFDGSGVRFWPEMMADLWPGCFAPEFVENEQQQGKYSADYMKANFKLQLDDHQFEQWFQTLVRRKVSSGIGNSNNN